MNLRRMYQEEKLRRSHWERQQKERTRYGVFRWRGDGRYKAEDTVGGKLYKRETDAQRKADKLNEVETVYVVRSILLTHL